MKRKGKIFLDQLVRETQNQGGREKEVQLLRQLIGVS